MLLLIGVISYWQAESSIYDNLDPGQNHLLELEAGESGEVSLIEAGKYVALRIEEGTNLVVRKLRPEQRPVLNVAALVVAGVSEQLVPDKERTTERPPRIARGRQPIGFQPKRYRSR